MSQSIGSMTDAQRLAWIQDLQELAAAARAGDQKALDQLPVKLNELSEFSRSVLDSLPELPPPSGQSGSLDALKSTHFTLSGLSMETLVSFMDDETRRTETRAGVQNLKARAEERAEANAKKMDALLKEIENFNKQQKLSPLMKAFKFLGMALAAVAGVALMAAGGVGSVILGAISLYMVADTVIQEATDGKVGIGIGFAAGKIAEATGSDDETVKKVQLGVDIAMSAILLIANIGYAVHTLPGAVSKASAQVAEKLAEGASEAMKAAAPQLAKAQVAARIVGGTATLLGGVSTTAGGITSIINAEADKDTAFQKAFQKKMEAILMRISLANEMDSKHLEQILENTQKIASSVDDIIDESNATSAALLSGRAPAMA